MIPITPSLPAAWFLEVRELRKFRLLIATIWYIRKKQTPPLPPPPSFPSPNAADILYKVILTCLHNWLWQLSDMIPNHKKMLQVLLEKACRREVDFGQVPKIMCKRGPHYQFMAAFSADKKCDPTG